MIYSVNYEKMADCIKPISFVNFLKDNNWSHFKTKRTDIMVFQKRIVENDFQVKIPMDKTLYDYRKAMYRAIETVSLAEKQDMGQLVLLLLNPNADILKVRLDCDSVANGNIFLDYAIQIYDNAKRLLTATAQDVINPRPYHRGRVDESVNRFVNSCRFGQTEIGSYIVPIICPFAELDDSGGYRELTLFPNEEQCYNSLTRKVTNRVMNNIYHIKSSIDKGEYDSLITENEDNVISANFYEALAGLNLEKNGVGLEFIAQWSPAVSRNRTTVQRIKISSDYYQKIYEIIEKLYPCKCESRELLGRIKTLSSSLDVEKRETGKVSIVYLDEYDKSKTIDVNLTREDYDKALAAHAKGKYVELHGKFTYKGTRMILLEYDSFQVIE